MVSTFPATAHAADGTHPIVKDTFAAEFSVGSDSRTDPARRRDGAQPPVGRVGASGRGVGEIEASAWVCCRASSFLAGRLMDDRLLLRGVDFDVETAGDPG